jgi:hypothetical protein
MINPSVLLFEKTVFPQALDKPCMDFITCSSLSENISAFKRHIDISFTSTEKILIPKNFVGPLEIKSL